MIVKIHDTYFPLDRIRKICGPLEAGMVSVDAHHRKQYRPLDGHAIRALAKLPPDAVVAKAIELYQEWYPDLDLWENPTRKIPAHDREWDKCWHAAEEWAEDCQKSREGSILNSRSVCIYMHGGEMEMVHFISDEQAATFVRDLTSALDAITVFTFDLPGE